MQKFSKDKPLAMIGAGVMGTKVAWACARAGLETRLFDTEVGKAQESAKRAESWSEGEEEDRVRENLKVCLSIDEAMQNVQLAFENVPEDLALKRRVLANISRKLNNKAYLGSNASSITVTPLNKQGHSTSVVYDNLDFDPDDISEQTFTLRYLKSRF